MLLWRWCPLGAGGRLLWLVLLSRRVPRLLPAFLLCLWCIALEYGSISRFKGVFRGFWGADVCLYGLRSLRGLWGFCVREWLGGYMACGVFAPIFSFLSSFLSSLLSSFLSFCSCCLCLSSCPLFVGCCFLFPFGCIRKKKGHKGLSLASSLVLL